MDKNRALKIMRSFTDGQVKVGGQYSRHELANIWGYASIHPLKRGVVTPAGTNKIILFVTEVKEGWCPDYQDQLAGRVLYWEGPNDHWAEKRMVGTTEGSADEIHLFYRPLRERLLIDFEYAGKLKLAEYTEHESGPSRFTFLVQQPQQQQVEKATRTTSPAVLEFA